MENSITNNNKTIALTAKETAKYTGKRLIWVYKYQNELGLKNLEVPCYFRIWRNYMSVYFVKKKWAGDINPQDKSRRCACCGRHISKLTPFGKAGDPLVGDFDGALLLKIYRPAGPYHEQAEKAFKRVEKIMEEEGRAGEDPEGWMIKIYGKEKGQQFLNAVYAYGCVGSSCECRDCIVLDTEEYFEQLIKRCSD